MPSRARGPFDMSIFTIDDDDDVQSLSSSSTDPFQPTNSDLFIRQGRKVIAIDDDEVDYEAVELLNDSDNSEDAMLRSPTQAKQQTSSVPQYFRSTHVGLHADDYMTDEQFSAHLSKLSILPNREKRRKLSPDSSPSAGARPAQSPSKFPLKSHTLTASTADRTRISYLNLKAGKSVQLMDGTFLRIKSLWKSGDQVYLRGLSLVAQKALAPMMAMHENELVWKIHKFTRNRRVPEVIEEITVPTDMVKRIRKIVFSNSMCEPQTSDQKSSIPEEFPILFCRWKITYVDISKDFVAETEIERLSFTEADENARIQQNVLRAQWRGQTALGGSSKKEVSRENMVNLEDVDPGLQGVDMQQAYTIGDTFCGAGGVSRGAKQAGLKVKWGIDLDIAAMKSYRSNFTEDGTTGLCTDISRFLVIAGNRFRVDILHASPPCQPFSAAHTTSQNVKRDEDNQAVMFSTWQLTEKLKPRIVTMEETEGIYARHPQYFFALVHTFVSLGYSVRWRVVNTYHYGVPQSRRRVYLYAAGPGEKLPAFPRPTHGDPGSGLLPFRTIADSIEYIPRGATHHDTHVRFSGGSKPSYDADRPAFTLTCGGGEHNFHPSGKRPYTVREMACLQTFPLNHSFADNNKTAARKQIGNAVPPRLAKVFLRACMRSLEASDKAELATQKAEVSPNNSPTSSSSSLSNTEFTFRSLVQGQYQEPLQRSFQAPALRGSQTPVDNDFILIG